MGPPAPPTPLEAPRITSECFRGQLDGSVQRPRQRLEQALHAAVAQYLSAALRGPTWWTTFPAGGGGKLRGALLRQAGMKAGVPDILVLHPRVGGGTTVIGIELKAGRGRMSQVQGATHSDLTLCNVRCRVARSIEDVQRILELEGVPLFARTWAKGWRRVA